MVAVDRKGPVTAKSIILTSLLTAALLGAATQAGGEDASPEGGGDAAAAEVEACPTDGEGEGGAGTDQAGGAGTDQASEPCPDPDEEGPGGGQPPSDSEADPKPDVAPETEVTPPDPTQLPPGDGPVDGGDGGGLPGGGNDSPGEAGPGGHDGRADGGHRGDHRSGNGGREADRDGRKPTPASTGPTTPTPTIASFSSGAISVSSADIDAFRIPPFLVPIYQKCGSRYGIPWEVLAAINRVETAFGSNLNVSSAGAVGWMQFLPSTWRSYGVDANHDGRANPYDPEDAICAAANYLRASGGQEDLARAIFAYNHADWYVDLVLAYAREYAGLYLPDPLRKASRLDPGFARSLAAISREEEVDWARVLAVLRARGARGKVPAGPDEVRQLAQRLSENGGGWLGKVSRAGFTRRGVELQVPALTRYNRAVGLRGLVKGLHAVSDRLGQRVLESDRLEIYEGGRQDIKAGQIDVRVLTLLLYLAEKYEPVTVTSLTTGHGYYARPGVASLHSFGRAVDIAALNDVPVLGDQEPGGLTERAVRDILLLPKELQPSELISLFELGGPSFAAADHHDHIHAGF
jgi:hypothetical protein